MGAAVSFRNVKSPCRCRGSDILKGLCLFSSQRSFTSADGRHDVLDNVDLSGEPLIPEIRSKFEDVPPEPIPLPEYYNNTRKLQDFRSRYQAYWSSTVEKSKTGYSTYPLPLPYICPG